MSCSGPYRGEFAEARIRNFDHRVEVDRGFHYLLDRVFAITRRQVASHTEGEFRPPPS